MEEITITETTRAPGSDGSGAHARPPFGGKRCLINAVPVRFERSFVNEIYNAGELLLTPG